MGGLTRPAYEGTEQIMDFYDSMNADGEYGYSVWYSLKEPAFQYWKDDAVQARKYLHDLLLVQEENEYKDLMYLKFHPLTGKPFDKKSAIISNTPIRACALEGDEAIIGNVPMSQGGGMNYKLMKAMDDLPGKFETVVAAKLSPLEERLKKLEDKEQDVEPPSLIGQIGGFLQQNPDVMQQVVGMAGQLLNNLFNQPGVQPIRVSGVNNNQMAEHSTEREINNDKLEADLDRLNKVLILDEDLGLLADFAENNPGMFNMLLQQLRSQKR